VTGAPGSRPDRPEEPGTGDPGTAAVVMMVGNDISHDTRVLKTALTLSDAGIDVTLLGYASSGRLEETRLGDVRIVRVPVGWRLRDGVARARSARRQHRLRLATDPNRRRIADIQANLRGQERASGGRPAERVRAAMARLGREARRARAGLDRRVERYERGAWRRWDSATARVPYGASWRRLLPEIDDYELAFGPVLDQLEWDVLHAHDVHLVGVASRAVARRRAVGAAAGWVYDAHEYVAGLSLYGGRTIRRRAAYLDLEREYVRDADAVVTVTEPLAETLRENYRLPVTPAVVMNSPVLGAGAKPVPVTIRDHLGLAADVPLAVYSGAVTSARGIDTAVAALPQLPGVHLAVIAVPHTGVPTVRELTALATGLGVADRLHLLEPVAPAEVSAYVSTADVGVLPLRHFGSHEVALPNKIFEYLYGGLPVLTSDTRASAEFVRRHGVGGVHIAADPDSFAAELRRVLEHGPALRRHIAEHPDLLVPYAWDQQEKTLRALYRGLLGGARVHEPTAHSELDSLVEVPASRLDRTSYLGIGPANMAGQAWQWAKALEREVRGIRTDVVVVDRGGPLQFEADELVPAATYAKDATWSQQFQSRALATWTHALLEAGRPVFGVRNGRDFTGDAEVLRAVGIRVGLLLHGSEIRDPSRHARWTPWSPFVDPADELTARLQTGRDALFPLVRDFDGPVFVSTPDLLLDVPTATWLPVVVDVDRWTSTQPVLEREVPVVLHAPSRASLKGTARVDAALRSLHEEGVVDYRLVEGQAPQDMPAVIAGADIVLDQFAIGSYGVLAVQAMAAGRVVLGHVMPDVRAAVPGELPVLEATPDRIADVIREVLADRDGARARAARSAAFAADVHDGRRAAAVLRDTLGLRGDPAPT
jgi:glycosyltransferase involved in cell wall biosynthesis